ncbi:TIGR04086 family membrane protein [Salipaludibacillus daqingensis]|uniref:TIGR04086 family membrane protein n=1 Tax=Salipaludibacillus daqingensis TaxID=3041001 RepID=UPI00247702CA|nr:TIGR04086 family membrane protein [Salipaludibacillus daqingensis]
MFSHKLISSVLYGVLTIFILVIGASLISSLILRFSNVSESSFFWILVGFSFVAMFIGGFISGGRSGERGWFAGTLTALIYSVIVLFTQFLSFDQWFDTQQMGMHAGYMVAAIFGGMIGVNTRGSSYREY